MLQQGWDFSKQQNKYGKHVFFMQASDFVINYLNKNVFVALSTFCDTFLHIIK